MNQITLQLKGLTCPSCMQKIIETVNKLKGVEKIKILFNSSKARIIFNGEIITETEIIHKITEIGYQTRKI